MAMVDRTSDNDPELEAITQVMEALKPLEEDARLRVLDYVFRRLGITIRSAAPGPLPHAPSAPGTPPPTLVAAPPTVQSDIRSLAETKKPKTAGEMAAVVAYYLSELAPATDRKTEIGVDDIKKYFKQANFRLPGAANMTLVHAKNAGYLDVGSGRGQYKLNPIGHNLVAHNLPVRVTGEKRKVRGRRVKPTRRK
jgi:hypothetical protein